MASTSYTNEGGGVISKCLTCGWERFHDARPAAERYTAGHTCRSGDRCLPCGRGKRLGDDGCTHYTKASR